MSKAPPTVREIYRRSKAKGDRVLDPLIEPVVKLLNEHHITTTQSCQGGFGHSYDEPTVAIAGGIEEALHAASLLITYGYKVRRLVSYMDFTRNFPTELGWEIELNFGPMHSGFFMREPEHCGKEELPMLLKMKAALDKRIKELRV